MKRYCLSCRFFEVAEVKAFPSAHGTCRRHAPRGPAIMPSSGGWSAFPPVGALSWCGEHIAVPEISPAAKTRGKKIDGLVARLKQEEA